MRLLTMRTPDGTRAARLVGDTVVELAQSDAGALLASDHDGTGEGPVHRLDDVELAPVVPHPSKILCMGHNYRAHIEEIGQAPPEHPTLFAKFSSALIGGRDPIVLPAVSEMVDWEAELAFVIGRRARHVTPNEADACIAGFTVLNDVSVRDWQRRTSQWLQGKTFEATTPVGPWLVTPDEVGGTAPDLTLSCDVDGVTMQEARTGDLLFGPAEIVAYASTLMTLEPGDLVSTGTPGGVGAGRTPPLFLSPGQVVRTTIEGVGQLVNPCVAEVLPAG